MENNTNTENKAKIKEIFSSIQGEGIYIGTKQLFIRFCSCNLKCDYCDTPHLPENINDKDSFMEFTPDELLEYLKKYDLESVHSVSLTGGEPLIWTDFLAEFLQKLKKKVYLETNATITHNLDKIIQYVDVLAADIKLPSASGIDNSFELHNKFFSAIKNYKIDCAIRHQFNCEEKKLFAKIVFDKNITDEEIDNCINLAKRYNLILILQPMMIGNEMAVDTPFITNLFEKFVTNYKDTRLIPQVHKFINIE